MRQSDTTEQTETEAGTPGRRALAAMAIAARRARETVPGRSGPPARPAPPDDAPRRVSSWSETDARRQPELEGLLRAVPTTSVWEPDHLDPWPPEKLEAERPASAPAPVPAAVTSAPASERERRLLMALAVVTCLVVLAAVTLAILEATGQTPLATAPTTPVTSAPPPAAHHRSPAVTSGKAHHRSGLPKPATVPPATPGAPPLIASISPTTGSSGQVVTITGSNFMSASGVITAHFGDQTAPISCPAQSTCTVTVPTLSGVANPVPLTVTTDSGTSSAAKFTYG